MQAVILAAGKGTRLHPLTLTRTKAMVPVLGRPLVGRVLETLLPAGISELILVVSPQDAALRDYAAATGLPVHRVVQQERLGMAQALALAAPWIQGPFVLSACDNLTSARHVAELVAAQRRHQAAAALSLMPVPLAEVSKTGVVVWDDPWVRRIVEKPQPEEAPSTLASLPLYVFTPDLLDYLPQVQPSPRGEYELQDAIQMLIDRGGRVTGVFAPERRQVTNAADLLTLNLFYLDQDPAQVTVEPGAQVAERARLVAPVYVGAGSCVAPGATVGPRAYLEGDCTVGAGATVRAAVVLRGGDVAAGAQVVEQLAG
jgi:glucose-1-phosphate thymidylyltransferase